MSSSVNVAVHDALVSGRSSSVWNVQSMWSLQGGILLLISSCSQWLIYCGSEQSGHTLRSFPLCGLVICQFIPVTAPNGIHFVKSKKSSIPYTLYSKFLINII